MSVKIVKDDTPFLIKAMLALSRDEVVVGVFADGPSRKEPDAPSNSAIAYVMETGSPAMNIPARPFLSTGMRDARGEIVAELTAGLKTAVKDAVSLRAIANGGESAVRQGLQAAGEVGKKAVKARMKSGGFAPLSPMTIRERRARGNFSTHPLIDTSQLYDAVEARVRKKVER